MRILVLLALLASACSAGGSTDVAPLPSSTCSFGAEQLPANCVDDSATPPPVVFPADPAKIPAVTSPKVPGELARAGNGTQATLRTATLSITVPKGERIGSDLTCLGTGTVTVDTVPKSSAFQTIACDTSQQPSALTAESVVPVEQDTTFKIIVTASGASRWEVAVFSSSERVVVSS